MRKRSLIVLMLGGFFYAIIFACMISTSRTQIVKAKEMVDISNGYFSYLDETEKASNQVLSDHIEYVADVSDEMEDYTFSAEDNSDYSESDSIDESGEAMNEFQIMVIFGFGLTAGVIVGHFLTGFIK